VLDEAHHLLPSSWDPATLALPQALLGLLLITVHPTHVSPAAVASVDTVVAVGSSASEVIDEVGEVVGRRAMHDVTALPPGEAVMWSPRAGGSPIQFTIATPHTERRRHQRKYAEGELSEDRSFYFRGPNGKLNLRAQNLTIFMQIGAGVDEATWLHHLRRGDYSRWFRDAIKDEELVQEAAAIEADARAGAIDSRARMRAAIERRYTLPT
jgi:hypothetical protein